MKLGEVVVIHVYYNFTKFHQNRMTNKKVLLIARFSVQNFKVSVESWKSYIVRSVTTETYLYIVWPSHKTMTLSNCSKILAEGWWMVHTMVRPSWASCLSNAIHCEQEAESSPEVGSSKNITGGLLTNSRAMANRFLWPPLNMELLVVKQSDKPNVSNISWGKNTNKF